MLYSRFKTEAEVARDRERTNRILTLCRINTPEAEAELKQLMAEEDAEIEERNLRIQAERTLNEAAIIQRRKTQLEAAKRLSKGQILNYNGDFRQSNLYRKSLVLYDLTYLFVERYLPAHGDRTRDQMIQAARSGKQNFVEGWEDGISSDDFALGLFSVGKGSLQELKEDYEAHLRTRNLTMWDKAHPRYQGLVEFCKTRNDIEEYKGLWTKMNEEELANMALTLLHQIDRMAQNFIKRMEQDILAGKGATNVKKEIHSALRRIKG